MANDINGISPTATLHRFRTGLYLAFTRWADALFELTIIANGNLWCPCTPPALLQIGPLARAPSAADTATHDTATTEATRYKLGWITVDDPDGYHRVTCPAVAHKLRCPHRPDSMTLNLDRPEVLTPPEHPPRCCTQQTITVPPDINAKTAQKHDYPGPA